MLDAMRGEELIKTDACGVVDLLKRGEVTPHDLLDALEARIAAVDPAVNALPTLCFARARAQAFGAAHKLVINPHTLRARMRKLGIDWRRHRSS